GPSGPITTQTPTFGWTATPSADHYDLWVDDQTTGQGQVLRLRNVTATSLTLSTAQALAAGHSYRWWVAAVSTNGQATNCSSGRTSRTPTSPALPPGATITPATPTFTWASVTAADHYDLWVNDVTSGQSQVVRVTKATGNSWALSAAGALSFGHSYVWWIGAV